MGDFAEEDLLVRSQVRRRSLSDEGFPVQKRHLSAPLHRQHFEKRRETESQRRRQRPELRKTRPKSNPCSENQSPEPENGGETERSGSFVRLCVNLPTWNSSPPHTPAAPFHSGPKIRFYFRSQSVEPSRKQLPTALPSCGTMRR